MGLIRKILIFTVLTAGIILLGRLAGRLLPRSPAPAPVPVATDSLRDSTNALPAVEADTTGGRWHERLFDPLERANGLTPKSLKRKPGYYELTVPKGKPIHEYALEIEKTCRARGIKVLQGAELHPANRSVEYLLESNGQRIKLRASLGTSVLAGAARLAVVFTGMDSLTLGQAQALQDADWDKTLVIDPYNPNPALRALRDGDGRTAILVELPMEPSAYPYVDPGKHALFIHHTKDDVERILGEALDSLPKAVGFASRYGDRAIENQPLLEKLFQFTARRKLLFLDFTGSQRSLARQTAAAQGARSRSLSVFRDSVHLEDELARKVALAQKTGEAVLAVPFTASVFRILSKSLEANAPRFNEMGLELVTLTGLSQPDTESFAPPADSAQAKPERAVEKPTAAKSATPARGGKAAAPAGKAPTTGEGPGSPRGATKPAPGAATKPAVKAKPPASAKPRAGSGPDREATGKGAPTKAHAPKPADQKAKHPPARPAGAAK
jgi:polysaccharide deacetylase 2 family uncharacterized protein YibQ